MDCEEAIETVRRIPEGNVTPAEILEAIREINSKAALHSLHKWELLGAVEYMAERMNKGE